LGWITLAAMLWGTVGVSTQAIYHLAPTNPLSIGFFRLTLALPGLLVACWLVLGRSALRMSRRDALVAGLLGLLLASYQASFFAAIRAAGVSIAVLVTLCTAPVIVAILTAILTRERPSRRVLVAMGCALLGTTLLLGGPGEAGAGEGVLLGVLLALGAALGYAAITLCGRAVSGSHPLQVTTISFVTGGLLLLVLALPSGFVATYPAEGWALLLYLGLVPTALAYGVFLIGMRSVSATVATVVTLLEPLVGTLLAVALFGERLGSAGALGAALLLGAVLALYRAG
jgi:DME family drug/metabolite transporter